MWFTSFIVALAKEEISYEVMVIFGKVLKSLNILNKVLRYFY